MQKWQKKLESLALTRIWTCVSAGQAVISACSCLFACGYIAPEKAVFTRNPCATFA